MINATNNLSDYFSNHDLYNIANNQFVFENQAGFQFDISHLILEDYYYKKEQEVIVEGFDGTYRWKQFITIVYVGMSNIYQYAFLKFILDTIGPFNQIYKHYWVLKVQVDTLFTYGF